MTYMDIYMYANTDTHTCNLYAHTNAHTNNTGTHTHTWMHTCRHGCMLACACTHTQTHTHTHMPCPPPPKKKKNPQKNPHSYLQLPRWPMSVPVGGQRRHTVWWQTEWPNTVVASQEESWLARCTSPTHLLASPAARIVTDTSQSTVNLYPLPPLSPNTHTTHPSSHQPTYPHTHTITNTNTTDKTHEKQNLHNSFCHLSLKDNASLF